MTPQKTFQKTLQALNIPQAVTRNILGSSNSGGTIIINNLVPVAHREEVLEAWDYYLAMSGRVVYKLATNN